MRGRRPSAPATREGSLGSNSRLAVGGLEMFTDRLTSAFRDRIASGSFSC